MLIHPWDTAHDEKQWRDFVHAQGFGHLVAAGAGRAVPVVVPTQFALDGDQILLHLARPNPIWKALAENPSVVLSIAGDWAYIPTHWKTVDGEDPAWGVPTTYYGAVQLIGIAEVVDDPAEKADLLRRQLADVQPEGGHVDPSEHVRLMPGLRGLRVVLTDVRAKFKYGGNVDHDHRRVVADHLTNRNGPGDPAALTHLLSGIAREER